VFVTGYAIIRIGGKQYRVREGDTLVVDRVRSDEGETFAPEVLLGGGVPVTARVVAHERGPKVRIGKYKRRTGYRRHTGFRAATSRIEISLGAPKRAAARKSEPKRAPTTAAEPARAADEQAAPTPAEAVPEGYERMTVAQIAEGAKGWSRPLLEAALAYERAHAARKGAIAALESALKAKED
jgi:large subunit ribosomal protein L21